MSAIIVKIMDGKKELTFTCNARHHDGTLIDFDNPEDRRRFDEAYISGLESVGWKAEPATSP